jgi:hypothetical protein
MSPANLLQIAGLNPLLELCFNLLQKITFQIKAVENYLKTSKTGPQELLIGPATKQFSCFGGELSERERSQTRLPG